MGGSDHWISEFQWLYKEVRSSSLARYNVDGNMDSHDRNLAQVTVRNGEAVAHHSAMIERLRSRCC